MFAFKPQGGSVVSFRPFYKIETGKYFAGIEVKKSLKSSWILSFSSLNVATICSKETIQDLKRWQFCNKTQLPFYLPSSIKNEACFS